MRNYNLSFLFKTNLLILLLGLFAFVCLGQIEQTRKCKEEDYDCRISNYANIVASKCNTKVFNYDCWTKEQTKIVESNPSDVAAYLFRGQTFLIKDLDRAILDYKTAFELAPQRNIRAFSMLVSAYKRKGEYDKAIILLNKDIEINPEYLESYLMLGGVYSEKGDYDQAILMVNKAIKLNPRNARFYASRGNIYYKKRDFDKALADYNHAIELDPKDELLYPSRASVYISLKNAGKAIADYSKAIELAPREGYLYYNRGFLYFRQGENAKASEDCQKAKELEFIVPKEVKLNNYKYCPL